MKDINESLVFFAGYFKNPGKVGTLFRSSRTMAKAVADEVIGEYVVEFGAGTGTISKEILKKIGKKGRLTVFEIDRKYCDYIEKELEGYIKTGRLKVVCDSANNYQRYVDRLPDTIVSGLPLASLNKGVVFDILKRSSEAKLYVQYQYSPFSTSTLKRFFKDVKIKRILRNIVPATMYICTN